MTANSGEMACPHEKHNREIPVIRPMLAASAYCSPMTRASACTQTQ